MSVIAPRLQFVLRPVAGRWTTCEFAIAIAGITVWPAHGADEVTLEIQIDDLLGYLTDFWKPLMLRQVYPINVTPSRPSKLRQAAEQRWVELPKSILAAEEEAVADFEEAHDLARCFSGFFGLNPFWLLRSGSEFTVDTGSAYWKLPFEAVRDDLSALGSSICDRLAKADFDRWNAAIEAWRQREDADGTSLLAWSAGLDRSLARELIEEGVIEPPVNFDDAANDNDELRIAARMAGALSPKQIRGIVGLAREFELHDAEVLRGLAKECADFIEHQGVSARPFEQGETAANFVRERLELASGGAVDVLTIVRSLGIEVRHRRADPPTLDGLAVWGRRHGPGVFLNETSSRYSSGARVTLAHELCHLLLDGGQALAAVEVLRARMPTGVEQRAKSFAGEFLLPRRIAAERWIDAGRPVDDSSLNLLLEELANAFGVTRSVAAWKLEHAAGSYGVDLGTTLDTLAPYR